jgi:hypothetical protein
MVEMNSDSGVTQERRLLAISHCDPDALKRVQFITRRYQIFV